LLNARLACTPTSAASRTSAELSTEYGAAAGETQMLFGVDVAQAVLPAEVTADIQRLLVDRLKA
jgi:hypothetical protein